MEVTSSLHQRVSNGESIVAIPLGTAEPTEGTQVAEWLAELTSVLYLMDTNSAYKYPQPKIAGSRHAQVRYLSGPSRAGERQFFRGEKIICTPVRLFANHELFMFHILPHPQLEPGVLILLLPLLLT